jgi:hypothetical protein
VLPPLSAAVEPARGEHLRLGPPRASRYRGTVHDSSEPPPLEIALLESYAQRIRERGVPFDERVRPGLSVDEIDETMASLGLVLPLEARVWWGWRDGQKDRGWSVFCPGHRCLSLAAAVEHYRFMREIAADTAEPGLRTRETADELWDPSWFPLTEGPACIVVDCSVEDDRPTPIRSVSFEAQMEEYWPPQARSLGEMVTWWCLAMDREVVVWDSDRELWIEPPREGRRSEIPGYTLL